MNFTPKTEREIADSKLWKRGTYDFEVLDAFERTSQAGNPMIELKLRIAHGANTRVLTDYLLEQTAEKLRHACVACGALAQYESGSLSKDDFVGKTGKLKLAVEKPRNGYAARNSVADYVVAADRPSVIEMLSR